MKFKKESQDKTKMFETSSKVKGLELELVHK